METASSTDGGPGDLPGEEKKAPSVPKICPTETGARLPIGTSGARSVNKSACRDLAACRLFPPSRLMTPEA